MYVEYIFVSIRLPLDMLIRMLKKVEISFFVEDIFVFCAKNDDAFSTLYLMGYRFFLTTQFISYSTGNSSFFLLIFKTN